MELQIAKLMRRPLFVVPQLSVACAQVRPPRFNNTKPQQMCNHHIRSSKLEHLLNVFSFVPHVVINNLSAFRFKILKLTQ